jgi:poly(glycerol-phosphate) alpha-glucosyltransferase
MHSICLLESVSRADGGIFEAECALQRELHLRHGMGIDVVGMEDRFSAEDASQWLPLKPRVIKVQGPAAFGYSPDLLPTLDSKADLLYAATLWKYPSWAARQWAERTGKPMIVAPHGSLDAWALANAAWKKRIAAALFKNRQLHKASCVRALCQSEAEAIRAYGLTNPIAIIPNGIELPEVDLSRDEGRDPSALKKLLFLGRIHPKKGLPNLLRGFKKALEDRPSSTDQAPWQLVIAGWDQGGHEGELKSLCNALGLSCADRRDAAKALDSRPSTLDSEVVFFGPAFGGEKKELLRSADAFILPSLSEGLPMSVLEAWAHELPVVMTPECNLPEGFGSGAAITIGVDAESIARGLNDLFSMSGADRCSMGRRGRELVKDRFTWRTIAAQMNEVYTWMLGGGPLPGCIRFH